jgi:ribosomal protein L7/L12
MAQSPIPPEVQQALQRGQLIEAIKLLREHTGLGLAEAKHVLEAYANAVPGPKADAAAATAIQAPPSMPAEAVTAMQRGNKIEAIRIYRAHNRVGLKEAKDAIDAFESVSPAVMAAGLAPGEVPPSRFSFWWWGALVVAGAVLIYLVFRRVA